MGSALRVPGELACNQPERIREAIAVGERTVNLMRRTLECPLDSTAAGGAAPSSQLIRAPSALGEAPERSGVQAPRGARAQEGFGPGRQRGVTAGLFRPAGVAQPHASGPTGITSTSSPSRRHHPPRSSGIPASLRHPASRNQRAAGDGRNWKTRGGVGTLRGDQKPAIGGRAPLPRRRDYGRWRRRYRLSPRSTRVLRCANADEAGPSIAVATRPNGSYAAP